MFEFIDKIKDKYRQNRVEKLLNVQKSLCEIEERIEELSKAQSHKYIRKEPDSKGGFNYIYDEKIVSHKWGEDDVVDPSKIFLNPVKQKTRDDITTFFIQRFEVKQRYQVPQDNIKDLWDENKTIYQKFGHKPEIKTIDVKNIVPSQNYINMTSLKGEKEKGDVLGISVPNSDKIILYNGHHRVAEKILNGDSEVSIKIIKSYSLKLFKHYQNVEKSFSTDYISELANLKLNKNKLLKSEQSLTKEDPLFKSMYDHMRFESTYKEVTKGYRQGQIDLDRCDEILKAINNDKKVKYSDNLVFNTEGKLLLLKRSELDKTFPGMYTIPGGHVDAGEDHRTAAIRELQEESGLTPDKDSQFTKVGEYEDDKVCIEYFLSYVDNDNDTLCLQSEEAWQYEWVDQRELDKYEFPLNMKQNIQKILYPSKEVIVKLGKAFKSGKITREKFVQALDVLSKSQSHKYIRKEPDGKGGWNYVYEEDKEKIKPITIEDIKLDNKGQIDIFINRDIGNKESGTDFPIKSKNGKILGYLQKRELSFGGWNWDFDFESKQKSANRYETKKDAINYFVKEYNSRINNDKTEEVKYKNINFKQIKEYGKRIIEGIDSLKRLSPKEEQGRLLGGRRNVEATLLIGRYEISDREEVTEVSEKVKAQEDLLESYAKEDKSWIEYETIKNDWSRIGGGEEASVYPDEEKGYVKKVYDYSLFSMSPLEFLDNRISLHNTLFPETKYELIGFTRNPEKGFSFIVKQPYVDHAENTPVSNVSEEMKKMGFEDGGGNFYYNEDYTIDDLHHKNVLTNDKGKLFFIDTVISLNEEGEGYGGKRKYGEITIPSNFDKSLQSINELYLQNRISDELYETIIEKAWNKSPIGTITTRSNGQKWKKVSETGNKDQDWQLVSKPKAGNKTDEPVSKEKRAEYGTKGKQPTISEHAKESSETALNNAIKESQDPEVREAAHQELDRRQKEEHVQEEDKKDGGEKKDPLKKKIEDLSDKYRDIVQQGMDDDFSDKNRTKQLSNKSKELSRYIQRIKRFGPDDKLVGLLELKKLLGLKSEKEVKDFFGDGEIISISVIGKEVAILTEDCYCERKFNNDGTVEMLEFILNPDLDKGQGKGSEIFYNQVQSFKNKGYKKLITDAAKSDVYNGYYTWARLGYEIRNRAGHRNIGIENFRQLLNKLQNDKELKDVGTVSELMTTKKGRDFWKENGFAFNAEFDLSDDSKSMFVLNRYMEEKKNAKK